MFLVLVLLLAQTAGVDRRESRCAVSENGGDGHDGPVICVRFLYQSPKGKELVVVLVRRQSFLFAVGLNGTNGSTSQSRHPTVTVPLSPQGCLAHLLSLPNLGLTL